MRTVELSVVRCANETEAAWLFDYLQKNVAGAEPIRISGQSIGRLQLIARGITRKRLISPRRPFSFLSGGSPRL